MADDEERALENQLELQLEEQRESLTAVKEALVLDPTNSELSSVHEELITGIKDAEEGLFHLKRSRLLQEADLLLSRKCSTSSVQDVAGEALDPTNVEAEQPEEKTYSVGSKCRFRHSNGQWYNGRIIGMDGSSARVTFLTPTSENMLICNFFQQQRCRFGNNCRLSHGIEIPVSSLKRYIPTTWNQSLVGSSIWATSDSRTGIWRKAELESWDDTQEHGQVIFEGDVTSSKVTSSSLSLSQYAQISSDSDDSSYGQSDDSDSSEEEMSEGLGFMDAAALQRGIQTDTAVFAKWENHTRGIASKMMANMGYREGMGLGVSGQGIVDPILVKVLKPKQSLDHAFLEKNEEGKEKEKKKVKRRSRGGKRKRDKKHADAARAEAEVNPNLDVFSFINDQLAQNVSAVKRRDNRKDNNGEVKKEDRKSLVGYDDEVRELRVQVGKLEEMVSRNRKEKLVFEAFSRKLNDMKKALAEAEAMKASASNEVVSKEKEKKWLKF